MNDTRGRGQGEGANSSRVPRTGLHIPRPRRGRGQGEGACSTRVQEIPLTPALSPEGRGSGALAVLAWGIVARVEGQLEVLVGIVFPELAHRGIREDHGVLELAAYPLHLAHVDVLDGIAPLVDDHGPAREVLELHLLEGSEEGLAVFYLAIDRLDGFHDPAHVRVAGLGVVRGNLACLGLEDLGVL